jgi:formate hydrogenlyase transcriptional activator
MRGSVASSKRSLALRLSDKGNIMCSAPQLAFDKANRLQSLKPPHNHAQLVFNLVAETATNLDLRDLLERLVDCIGRFFNSDAIYIALLDSDTRAALREFAVQFPRNQNGLQQLPVFSNNESRWLSGIIENGDPVCLDAAESAAHAVAGLTGFRSQCLFPLVSRGCKFGVLTLASRRERAFAPSDILFVRQVATQIAVVVENNMAHSEISALKEQLAVEAVYLDHETLSAAMFDDIVGSSELLLRALEDVKRVAPTDSTVLITGETGTGKELVARAIHKYSRRANRSFIRVNCAAIPQTLIASELFGHEKGAFTGATDRRLGRFELADGGTIFLDEAGDIPPDSQVTLLRVLQEREFERVGASRSTAVDVRVVAATNSDLNAAVDAGTFRLDLFYRLNVFPIRLPSLRERADDIPLLAKYFVDRYATAARKTIRNIHKKTLNLLQAYHWPGNVRELQNVIERAVILCDSETLSIPEKCLSREMPADVVPLTQALADRERQIIEAALEESRGRVSGPSGAAKKLGIPRSTLESRIQSLRINKYSYKVAARASGDADSSRKPVTAKVTSIRPMSERSASGEGDSFRKPLTTKVAAIRPISERRAVGRHESY